MSSKIVLLEQAFLRKDLPEFPIGATVRVNLRIIEGEKERIQAFEGIVMRKHRGSKNLNATFTVRKTVQNYGVERIFLLHSPKIESIQVLKVGKVRRAKLYYLRDLRGKAARIREKVVNRTHAEERSETNTPTGA